MIVNIVTTPRAGRRLSCSAWRHFRRAP